MRDRPRIFESFELRTVSLPVFGGRCRQQHAAGSQGQPQRRQDSGYAHAWFSFAILPLFSPNAADVPYSFGAAEFPIWDVNFCSKTCSTPVLGGSPVESDHARGESGRSMLPRGPL